MSSQKEIEENISSPTSAKEIATTPKAFQNNITVLDQQILEADILTEDLEAWFTGSGCETDILLTDNDIVVETNKNIDQGEDDSSYDDDLHCDKN